MNQRLHTDFLVLGSGIAGLRAAVGLARHGSVLVVTKDQPSESNTGGSIHGEFNGCNGLNYSSGFGFDDPPADRAAEVRKQVHEEFTDFAKTCPMKPDVEARLMAGFAEAFAAVDKLMTDKPNVYPPEPAEDGNSQDQSST